MTRPLRTRDVATILKLRFDLSAGEIDLERVLEEMIPPEQGAIPVFGSQETQDEVFVIGGSFVKKARSHEEMDRMDTEGSSSQSPSRKRIRSDSDAGKMN